jgi:hypothetical protein
MPVPPLLLSPSHLLLLAFPYLPFLPFFYHAHVWSCATTSALEARSPTLLSSFQTPDACVHAAVASPPKLHAPSLHLKLLCNPSWEMQLHFYLFPFIVIAHLPLQTFLDFNAMYIMIQRVQSRCTELPLPLLCSFTPFHLFAEWPSFRIPKPPEWLVLVVTGSWVPLPTLRAGLSGCSVSFLVMSPCTLSTIVGASVSHISFGIPRKDETHPCFCPGRPITPMALDFIVAPASPTTLSQQAWTPLL